MGTYIDSSIIAPNSPASASAMRNLLDALDSAIALLASQAAGTIPAGSIMPFAGSSAPSGWLLCSGQAVSRSTYAALFAVISTTYGAGDGSTTFNLPDLRGRFPLGKDNMGGSSANNVTATQADNLGQSAGAETHTLTISEMPAHDHAIKGSTNTAGGATSMWAGNTAGASAAQMQGGGAAHNNMPPYLTLNYLVKT